MLKAHRRYHGGAELFVFASGEVHMRPSSSGVLPPSGVKDFLRLKKSSTLYTKHPITDMRTPRMNSKLGFKEIKRDFAFVYYST